MTTAIPRKLLTEREAAEYLGYRPASLRQSRFMGTLAGAKPPKHTKLGRGVRYDIADLNAWIEQVAKEVSA
ncbi:helix-turn-helix domain-containing protein [Halomonas sp. Mc5H-6]|uniref:helix-turn-helix transcriptional regulator n=1 Tax=Halomonas sp. Mc5H-6 TaxID=2954500 RepID=UPI002096C859|nr:helix-turn-helix domain-containing protein [Halomonas sp. Mc5H-6]MCO7248062.1 helix-turn-helix domain-containing protein [Halomonas sp. Mc5H-6]